MAKKKIRSSSDFQVKLYTAIVALIIFLIALSFYGYFNAKQSHGIRAGRAIKIGQNPTPIQKIAPDLELNQPNKLVVTRQNDPVDHLSALNITVSDPVLVKKMFDDIYLLPTLFPYEKCPLGGHVVYTLTFYQNNKLTDTAVFTNTLGCILVKLDNSAGLVAQYPFIGDFLKATGLTEQTLW